MDERNVVFEVLKVRVKLTTCEKTADLHNSVAKDEVDFSLVQFCWKPDRGFENIAEI